MYSCHMDDENQILQRVESLAYKIGHLENSFKLILRSLERRILELEHEQAAAAGTAPTLLKSIRELQGSIGEQAPSVRDLLDTFYNERN